MCRFARDGRHLVNLVSEATAVCRAADVAITKTKGPGRPEVYQQWQIAPLILIAVNHRCKSKSSQYSYLLQHAQELQGLVRDVLLVVQLPSRATFMRRFCKCHPLLARAIVIGGRRAVQEHVADAHSIAIDKSLIGARGPCPPWRRNKPRKGVDQEAGWGKSRHDGWVWGYSYEVAVSAGKNGVVVPLLASADTAAASEHRTAVAKVPDLPACLENVLGDSGYDSNALGDAIEYTCNGKRTGRRLLCPLQRRGGKPCVGQQVRKGQRERQRQRRLRRYRFMQSRRGKQLYARRRETVEPFNDRIKHLFDLEDRVWHRGVDNNRTMLLASIFSYQLLQRYNYALGNRHGQIQWILDGL
jgi:hypothetical protein